MKKLLRVMLKAMLRCALSYAGEAAAWCLDRAHDRTVGRSWTSRLAAWARDAARLFADFAEALADGSVTDAERKRVANGAQAIADRVKEFLQ